jgi:hypothetical protein
MNLIRNVFAASAVLLAVAVSAPASSNAAVYNFLQNACDASLGCNGSSALVATATTVDVTGLFGFGVQVTIHRVDSNFDFYQAGQPPVTMTGWHASADPTAVIPPTQLTIGGEAVIWGPQLAPYPDFNPGSVGTMTGGLGYSRLSGAPGSIPGLFATDIVYTLIGLTTASITSNGTVTDGYFFAQEFCNNSPTQAACIGPSGFIGAVEAATPLPPAAWLFGTALVGMGIVGRGRRKKILSQQQA